MHPSLNKQIPLYGALIFFLTGALVSMVITRQRANNSIPDSLPKTLAATSNSCELSATRINGYEYVKPLLFAEQACESPNLASIKNSLIEMIDSLKSSGDLVYASVYLRVFVQGEWMSINEEQTYHPGSLYKVPIMIAYMRMAEKNPALLDKELTFELSKDQTLPASNQNYVSRSIELGKKYTIRELLRYAISYSDNNAYWLLLQHLDEKVVETLFIDTGIGLQVPDASDNQMRTTAKAYSVFMKTLYNSSYLSPDLSEFAMSLLGESQFKDGMESGLPAGTKVAHKFGEWDDKKNFELHESGVVYLKGKPFLATIMTRGKRRENLPPIIAAITKRICEQIRP